MKPALFVIQLFLEIILVFTLLIFGISNYSLAQEKSSQVTVSVTIDEHLSFQKIANDITISTNCQTGIMVIDPKNNLIKKFYGPTVQQFNLQNTDFIIITTNF